MKIRVSNMTFDNVIVTEDTKILRLKVDVDMSMDDIRPLIEKVLTSTNIEILDDEDIVLGNIGGTFTQPCVIINSLGKTVEFRKKTDDEKSIEELNHSVSEIMESLHSQLQPLSIVFVQMAQDGTLDDTTISEHPNMFSEWNENWTGKAGTILRDGDKLYRSIHDVTTTAQNTKPADTPSMWTVVADPNEEYPTWVQPIGAFDTYSKGDKVAHNDKKWVSVVDNNVWQPGVYGWEEIRE